MPPRRSEQPTERSFWEVFPKRSLRRALMLLMVLGAVLVLRRSGGVALNKLVDGLVQPVPRTAGAAAAGPGAPGSRASFQPMRVVPAPSPGPGAGGAHP
jgi:hypothetical protein